MRTSEKTDKSQRSGVAIQRYLQAISALVTFLLIVFVFSTHAIGQVPESPSGLAAIEGYSEASLTWAAVSGATSYALYRGTTSNGPFSFVAQPRGTGFTNRGLSNGSTYYYVVTALNADGQSGYSAAVNATPLSDVLAAPTGVRTIQGNTEVSVVWNPVTSAVSYNVYRATSRGGPYALLSPAAPGPSFTDKGLTNGTPYFYVVQTKSTKVGAYSDEVDVIPSGSLPISPVMGSTAVAGNGEASLTWDAVSGAASYALYRGTERGGPYSFLAETQGTGYTSRGLSNGSPYYYIVTALNANGQSAYSALAAVTPQAEMLPAPAGVKAISGNGEASIIWNPVTSAVSYNVFRATSRGGPYTVLSPPAPGPSFTDRGLTNDTEYFYVVQTMSTNPGAYSDEVSVIASESLPVAPANLTVDPGSTWARLSWSPSAGATAYAVYRSTTIGGPYAFVAQPETTVYEDLGLSNGSDGTTYWYDHKIGLDVIISTT